MKKEDVILLAQLLNAMKELSDKIELYHKNQSAEKLVSAKREFMNLQRKIEDITR